LRQTLRLSGSHWLPPQAAYESQRRTASAVLHRIRWNVVCRFSVAFDFERLAPLGWNLSLHDAGRWQSLAISECGDAQVPFNARELRRLSHGEANDEGIGLAVLWPFRLGHPPLFIPWSEMNMSQVNWLYLFPLVRFDFEQEPSVALFIEPKLARKIQEAIGQSWFQKIG
jgi:hypothetical protein